MIWGGRKKGLCCCCSPHIPHCYLTPIIFQVITLLGFTHSFHALCGLVVVALNCGLIIVLVYPPKHTVKAPPPPSRSLSHKVAELICLQQSWNLIVVVYQGVRAQSLSRRHQVCGCWSYLQAAQVDFPSELLNRQHFSNCKQESVIAKESELQSDSYWHQICHWILYQI